MAFKIKFVRLFNESIAKYEGKFTKHDARPDTVVFSLYRQEEEFSILAKVSFYRNHHIYCSYGWRRYFAKNICQKYTKKNLS